MSLDSQRGLDRRDSPGWGAALEQRQGLKDSLGRKASVALRPGSMLGDIIRSSRKSEACSRAQGRKRSGRSSPAQQARGQSEAGWRADRQLQGLLAQGGETGEFQGAGAGLEAAEVQKGQQCQGRPICAKVSAGFSRRGYTTHPFRVLKEWGWMGADPCIWKPSFEPSQGQPRPGFLAGKVGAEGRRANS